MDSVSSSCAPQLGLCEGPMLPLYTRPSWVLRTRPEYVSLGWRWQQAEATQRVKEGGVPAVFFRSQTSQDGTFGKIRIGRRRKNFHSLWDQPLLIFWCSKDWHPHSKSFWLRYYSQTAPGSADGESTTNQSIVFWQLPNTYLFTVKDNNILFRLRAGVCRVYDLAFAFCLNFLERDSIELRDRVFDVSDDIWLHKTLKCHNWSSCQSPPI